MAIRARPTSSTPEETVKKLASDAHVSIPGDGALVGSNGPMTVLGVTDPRTWAVKDWVSDVVPHLAYGAVAAGVLREV